MASNQWAFVLREGTKDDQSSQKILKDLVMQFWKALSTRLFNDSLARNQAPAVKAFPTRLYGWDYLEIIRGEQSERKKLHLDGSWEPFSKRVLVLFGQKFGKSSNLRLMSRSVNNGVRTLRTIDSLPRQSALCSTFRRKTVDNGTATAL